MAVPCVLMMAVPFVLMAVPFVLIPAFLLLSLMMDVLFLISACGFGVVRIGSAHARPEAGMGGRIFGWCNKEGNSCGWQALGLSWVSGACFMRFDITCVEGVGGYVDFCPR